MSNGVLFCPYLTSPHLGGLVSWLAFCREYCVFLKTQMLKTCKTVGEVAYDSTRIHFPTRGLVIAGKPLVELARKIRLRQYSILGSLIKNTCCAHLSALRLICGRAGNYWRPAGSGNGG